MELQRRLSEDPRSDVFADLAEAHRLAGNFEESVRVSRTGLARQPSHVSARVTLGLALIALDQLDEAEHQLAQVLISAPESLAAIRGRAEIHQRRAALAPASSGRSFDFERLVRSLGVLNTGTGPDGMPAVAAEAPELLETAIDLSGLEVQAGSGDSLASLELQLRRSEPRQARNAPPPPDAARRADDDQREMGTVRDLTSADREALRRLHAWLDVLSGGENRAPGPS